MNRFAIAVFAFLAWPVLAQQETATSIGGVSVDQADVQSCVDPGATGEVLTCTATGEFDLQPGGGGGSPFTEPFEVQAGNGEMLFSVDSTNIFINEASGGAIVALFFRKAGTIAGQSADIFEISYNPDPLIKSARSEVDFTITSQGDLILGTVGNEAIIIPFEATYVEIKGCRLYPPSSAAPSTGVGACDEYYDTDLNLTCTHNGTEFVQNDDWATACL